MYKYLQENGCVKVFGIKDFNLKDIFECGQCFRWNPKADGSYSGVAMGKPVNVRYEEDSTGSGCLIINKCTTEDFEKIWMKYFDLERNYKEIKTLLSEDDEIMQKAVEFGKGIRILNQDEWETLISFILSQNSNIPRIKRSIETICQRFGEKLQNENGESCYAFPTPQRLAQVSETELSDCRLGYRANYVLTTAKQVAENPEKLYEMAKADYDEAMNYLLSLKGVGPKVANCILLFAMEKYSSFPIDVWVKRLMSVLYGTEENDLKGIKAYAEEHFRNLGGFAQQYLFYYARENNIGK